MPFEEVAFDGFGRGVGDGVNQTVQTIPMLAEFDEEVSDLFVAGDIERENQRAVEFGGKLVDAVDEALVLVGESQLCAFTMAGLGDAIGNGVLGQQTGDQNFLVGEKAHLMFSLRGLARDYKASHVRIGWPFTTLRHDPVDILRWILDVAGLAMHAVLRIDLQARVVAAFVAQDFINAGRAEALFRGIVKRQIDV
jgi:hypothetical protein